MSCKCKCEKKIVDVMAQSRAVLPKEVLDFIDECLKSEHPGSYLIAVLHKVQDHFGFLDKEKMAAVAQLMQIPMANVSGVASFYHYFRLKPAGKYTISVCTGTACYIKGAEALVNKVKEMLSIEPGDTTSDGMFTLDITRCLGTCALAPIIKVGDHVYPRVTPDQIPLIIEECLKK